MEKEIFLEKPLNDFKESVEEMIDLDNALVVDEIVAQNAFTLERGKDSKETFNDVLLDSQVEFKKAKKTIESRVLRIFKMYKEAKSYMSAEELVVVLKGFDFNQNMGVYNKQTGEEIKFRFDINDKLELYAKEFYHKVYLDFKNRKGESKYGFYQRMQRLSLEKISELNGKLREKMLIIIANTTYQNGLTQAEIASLWGMERATTDLNKLVKSGHVITQEKKVKGSKRKVATYIVSPDIAFSGSGGNKKNHDVKIYTKTLLKAIEAVRKEEEKIKEEINVSDFKNSPLSTLMLIIPLIHFETLQIVDIDDVIKKISADDEDISDSIQRKRLNGEKFELTFLNATDIGNLSKSDQREINRNLFILEQANVLIIKSGIITMNPDIFWCQDDSLNDENKNEYLKNLRNDFYFAAENKNQQRKDRLMEFKKMAMVQKRKSGFVQE